MEFKWSSLFVDVVFHMSFHLLSSFIFLHAYIILDIIVVSVTNEAVSDGRASAASGDISIKVGSDGRASVAESGSQFGGSRDGQFFDVLFNINK